MSAGFIVDIHHHIAPPAWLKAIDDPLMKPFLDWSPQRSIDAIGRAGVAMAIGSVGGFHTAQLPPPLSVSVARACNDYAARLVADFPRHFGAFGILPMPHVKESLDEIRHVFEDLRLDGIELLSSYSGRWLGHPDFRPVLEALEDRGAVVHVHPALWDYSHQLVPGAPIMPFLAAEVGMDTTRAIISLIFGGAAERLRDAKLVFSHGGGALVALAERLLCQIPGIEPFRSRFTRQDVQAYLSRFHYDTAQILNAGTLAALLDLVPDGQVLFGTDWPFRTVGEHVDGLARSCSPEQAGRIAGGNALRLLPRLAASRDNARGLLY